MFSPARILSTSSSSCRAGLARRMTALRSLPRPIQAGAEFVDDDREALAFGQPVDVVQQVGVDRAVGVGDRQVVLARAFVGRRGSSSAGAAAALLRPAAGWGRSRRTSRRSEPWGRIVQVASLRKFWKPGLPMLSTTAALAVRRGFDRFDGADFDGGDVDVLPRDDVGRVVEDRAHGVGVGWEPPAEVASSTTATSAARPMALPATPTHRSPPPGLSFLTLILPCGYDASGPTVWWGRPWFCTNSSLRPRARKRRANRLLLGARRLVCRRHGLGHGRVGPAFVEDHFGLDREPALRALLRNATVGDRFLHFL